MRVGLGLEAVLQRLQARAHLLLHARLPLHHAAMQLGQPRVQRSVRLRHLTSDGVALPLSKAVLALEALFQAWVRRFQDPGTLI